MIEGGEELAPGLHRWTAFHPEWKKDVGCIAWDGDETAVLVDPQAPPALREARRFWKSLDRTIGERPVAIVLTLHYHLRSTEAVLGRYRPRAGAALWASAETAARLHIPVDRELGAGDVLPGGLVALPSGRPDEVVLWVPAVRALVTGDVLLGGVRKQYRVCPASWLPTGATRVGVARALLPLLELDVELLVPLHGPPVVSSAREALASAVREALET